MHNNLLQPKATKQVVILTKAEGRVEGSEMQQHAVCSTAGTQVFHVISSVVERSPSEQVVSCQRNENP